MSLSNGEFQAWIEKTPRHIQEIIRLKGGNEYVEGGEATPRNWRNNKAEAEWKQQPVLYIRQQARKALDLPIPIDEVKIAKPSKPPTPPQIVLSPHQDIRKWEDLSPPKRCNEPRNRKRHRQGAQWR